MLALHGWLDNAMSFARLAPRLDGLRIVALDLPGHGHSGHRAAGAGYALWDYAQDALLVAEQFGWQRFSLLGHSLGAIVATLLAGALPERIERTALIDGLFPLTHERSWRPPSWARPCAHLQRMGDKRKPVYASVDKAVSARLRGGLLSREAAELLASRGLVPQAGGYTGAAIRA